MLVFACCSCIGGEVFCIFGSTVGLGTHFAFVSAGTSSVIVCLLFLFSGLPIHY